MIFEKINQLEKELKSRFEVEFEYNDEVLEYDFEATIRNIGIDVKFFLNDITKIHNGFSIKIKKNQEFLSEAYIIELSCMFSSVFQERFIQVYDEWGEEFKKFARQFYPLDIYEESLDEVTLTVVKIIDEEHLELWIWNNAGQKYKLKFNSIEEYLEAGVKCKFIVCWQYFYIDTDALDFNDPFTKEWIANGFGDAIYNMNHALTSMKKYFHEEDWSYQEGELERVKLLN